MLSFRRQLLLAAVIGLGVLLPALPAFGQEFGLPEASVEIQVEDDGSLLVTEHITYDFDGSFSGGYREIPLRAGESITDIEVSEGGLPYAPGGCTDLGCNSPPSTFGSVDLGGRIRIVWHYSAFGEQRTFDLSYRFLGLAKAADDVVDVNLQVWGDDWAEPLDRLTATMSLPGLTAPGEVFIWGHPSSVAGTTSLGTDRVQPSLEAFGVSPGQFVEMRVMFPRRLLTSTEGATVIEGNRAADIIAEEEQAAAADRRRAGLIRALVIGLGALTFGPGLIGVIYIYLRYGKEPRVAYDREYEQEPPSELPPAEVGALLTQGRIDERQFTATLFDLISRGVIAAKPVQIEKTTWAGLRSETISDLELALTGKEENLLPYEQHVLGIVTRVLDGEARPLNEFRTRIREDASANASAYQSFRSTALKSLEGRKMIDRRGTTRIVIAAGALIVLAFIVFFLAANFSGATAGVVVPLLILAVVFNGVVLGVFAVTRRGYVKRTPDGALQAARWDAFRRYLKDFSRLHEAPAISLALWDRFLVYAVGFGLAEEVLEAARLRAPAELTTISSIYWYGGHGYTGGGTENAFSGLSSALNGAFSPPGGSGGGGGFSGGGGAAEEAAAVERGN